jgi:hypothetical protein
LGLETLTPGKLVVAGSPIYKLAGIMEAAFNDRNKVIETKDTPFVQTNIGIAAIVPSYKLHEILFSDELKKKRGF